MDTGKEILVLKLGNPFSQM